MEEKLVSRRGFIMGAAAAATGAALLGSPLALAADGDPIPAMGAWKPYYTPVDPYSTGKVALDKLYGAATCTGCGGRSAGAIIEALAAAKGWPWTTLPVNVGSFQNGGGPYGTTCGGVMGPYYVMCLVGAGGALGAQWHKWCSDTAFPSTEWDEFSSFKNTIQTVAGSPQCHTSRATWENAYLRQWDRVSPYDSSRCPKMYADMTKKAVQMLNDWYAGIMPTAWTADADYESCYSCHTQLMTDHEVGAIHSGKESCNNCHDTKVPSHGSVVGNKPR
jgi:hypothetical protein